MLTLISALLLSQNPVISPRHPQPASPWSQAVRANCRRNVLIVEGYGAGRPLDRVPVLRLNNRPVRGSAVPQLLADLSHVRAVYRLAVLCGDSGDITLHISEGEKPADGPVRYRSAAAQLRGDRLLSYTGFQESNAESFWFR